MKWKVAVGDVVLVQDDTPQINWKLAVTKELIVGHDELVKVVISEP